MKFLSPILSILLMPLVAVLPLAGQVTVQGSGTETNSPVALQLAVVGGETGGSSMAGSRMAQGITVEVKDAAGRSVEGTAVVFRLPDSSPTGKFADGTASHVVYTDASGRAGTGEIRWDAAVGSVPLRITAAKGTAHAGLLLNETLTGATPAVEIPVARSVSAAEVNNVARVKTPGALMTAPRVVPGVTVEHRNTSPRRQRSSEADDEDEAPVPVKAVTRSAQDRTAPLTDDNSIDANVPIRHAFASESEDGGSSGVSVTNTGGEARGGHSKKKWIIAIAAAAGAGVAVAMLHSGSHSGASSASGVSIGAPSISVGHP